MTTCGVKAASVPFGGGRWADGFFMIFCGFPMVRSTTTTERSGTTLPLFSHFCLQYMYCARLGGPHSLQTGSPEARKERKWHPLHLCPPRGSVDRLIPKRQSQNRNRSPKSLKDQLPAVLKETENHKTETPNSEIPNSQFQIPN